MAFQGKDSSSKNPVGLLPSSCVVTSEQNDRWEKFSEHAQFLKTGSCQRLKADITDLMLHANKKIPMMSLKRSEYPHAVESLENYLDGDMQDLL